MRHPWLTVASCLGVMVGTTAPVPAWADEAERVYRRGLGIRERRLGPDDPQVVVGVISLGSTLGRQKRSADAAREYRRALAIPDLADARESLEFALRDDPPVRKAGE
jgi:hypothetical protein